MINQDMVYDRDVNETMHTKTEIETVSRWPRDYIRARQDRDVRSCHETKTFKNTPRHPVVSRDKDVQKHVWRPCRDRDVRDRDYIPGI